mmetsp:Transcript_30830/g.72702  ORF Transcript_30830/g.72702 Transcript_30830/m.72702 type:complete len:247 (+) Transcript_30830:442-1182(+)
MECLRCDRFEVCAQHWAALNSFRFVLSKEVILVLLGGRRISCSLHVVCGGHLVGIVHVQSIVRRHVLFGLLLEICLFLGLLLLPVVFLLLALDFLEATLLALAQGLLDAIQLFRSCLLEFLDTEVVFFDADPANVVGAVVANLAVGHSVGLFQVLPSSVDHAHLAFLAPGDGIGLDHCRTIQYCFLRYVVHRHSRLHSKIDVSRRQIVDVKPNIFRMTILDQELILALILSHVQIKRLELGILLRR